MSDIFIALAAILFGAVAAYCAWHGIKALRTGVVDSPTALSLGTTKASDAPVSFWIQVAFWFAAAGILGFTVARWLRAVIAA